MVRDLLCVEGAYLIRPKRLAPREGCQPFDSFGTGDGWLIYATFYLENIKTGFCLIQSIMGTLFSSVNFMH